MRLFGRGLRERSPDLGSDDLVLAILSALERRARVIELDEGVAEVAGGEEEEEQAGEGPRRHIGQSVERSQIILMRPVQGGLIAVPELHVVRVFINERAYTKVRERVRGGGEEGREEGDGLCVAVVVGVVSVEVLLFALACNV